MTPAQFRKLAMKLFGRDRGWQQRCADALRVDKSSVSRWLNSTAPIPGPAAVALKSLAEIRRAS